MRRLCRTDLFFLLRYVLERPDLDHDWLFQRCRDVTASPDGMLDLWARGHYKSTIITFAKTIQDILASHGNNPLPEWKSGEPCFVIFSHTRPISKAFLRQIMWTLQGNETLKALFPDVLYQDPANQSPKWSEDDGILVKRRSSTMREATVEAWGLVDAQPTSKHFQVMIYDDTVTLESVTTPLMMEKVANAWKLSLNLGDQQPRKRMIGTRYHFADLYGDLIRRGVVKPRILPGTDDGTLTGKPVYLTQEQWDNKVREMGPYVASAQLLQNPLADSKQTFQRSWLRHYKRGTLTRMSPLWRMLLCDPANSKKKKSDWTTMGVIGAGADRNLYVLDFLRDRLSLNERATAYIEMHQRWNPQYSGYEEYGMQADIEYIREEQMRRIYNFDIQPMGGKASKVDRIGRLMPYFSASRFYLPDHLHYTNYEGRVLELVEVFTNEEYAAWPVPLHDDILDMFARCCDEGVIAWPKGPVGVENSGRDRYKSPSTRSAWSN